MLHGGSVEKGQSERSRTWNEHVLSACSECFAHMVPSILNQPTQVEGANRMIATRGGKVTNLSRAADQGAGQGSDSYWVFSKTRVFSGTRWASVSPSREWS